MEISIHKLIKEIQPLLQLFVQIFWKKIILWLRRLRINTQWKVISGIRKKMLPMVILDYNNINDVKYYKTNKYFMKIANIFVIFKVNTLMLNILLNLLN
jgi:hypothetical protein